MADPENIESEGGGALKNTYRAELGWVVNIFFLKSVKYILASDSQTPWFYVLSIQNKYIRI